MEISQDFTIGPGGVWEQPPDKAGGLGPFIGPPECVQQALNLFVDSNGVLRGRNGVAVLQGTTFATERMSWVWEGTLTPGVRTVFTTKGINGSPGGVDPAHGYGVFDGANNAVKLPVGGGFYYQDYPTSYVLLDGLLFLGNQAATGNTTDTTKQGLVYGGSRKTSPYVVGGTTLSVTAGSAVVTQAAGGFTANVDVGMLLYFPGAGSSPARWLVVKSVDSDTQITLAHPWPGSTGSTQAYFQVLGLIGSAAGTSSYRASKLYGSCAGRLLSLEGNKLYVSDGPDPATGLLQPHSFPAANVIEFPLDAQGVSVQTIRNQVFVFTSQGLYRLTGLEYDIVDADGNPQWTIELLSHETIALSHAAIVTWHQALIVPCVDGVWIIDGVNPPQSMTLSMDWASIVNAGRQLGQAAVFQGFYLLPIEVSNGVGGASALQFETHVFRLQPIESGRGIVFPRTRWGCDVESWYASGPTRLLATYGLKIGAGSNMFNPASAYTKDGGVTSFTFQLTSRPVPVPAGSVLRRVRLKVARDADNGQGFPNGFPLVYSDQSASALTALTTYLDGRKWVSTEPTAPVAANNFVYLDYQDFFQRPAFFGIEYQYRAGGLPA